MNDWKKDVRTGLLALLALCLWIVPWLLYGLVCIDHRQTLAALAPNMADGPVVAITFDDGPRPKTTSLLLDGLAQRGVHATFFVIGLSVEGNEALLQRMDAEGHQIGIHSKNHKGLTQLNGAELCEEIEGLRQMLTEAVGPQDFMLRPPYGWVDDHVRAQADCPIILWSIDPEDWADHNTARQVREITGKARDGDIILLHDVYPSSVATALQVVDALQAQGFRFVTVEELFALRGIQPENGKVYYKLPAAVS